MTVERSAEIAEDRESYERLYYEFETLKDQTVLMTEAATLIESAKGERFNSVWTPTEKEALKKLWDGIDHRLAMALTELYDIRGREPS